jgi:predicted ribosome quality control (RQC) complex YloA/Tae2 family protein
VFAPLDSGEWSPRLYLHAGGATFAAIQLHHLEGRDDVTVIEPTSVVDAAAQAREHGAPDEDRPDRHAPRRARLIAEIEEARTRLARRRSSLERQAEETADVAELRAKGEMIYAYLWMIEAGMSVLETPDRLSIELDPELSPKDNAQAYFERYRKAQSAGEEIPKRLSETDAQLAYVDQLLLAAGQAESYDDIESVRIEWQEYAANTQGVGTASRPGGSRPSQAARRPRRVELESGSIVWIGRTGKQNDAVTFEIGGPEDLWLHAREMPGAHVILRPPPGRDADERDIARAAALAAHYSAGRGAARVPIDVTQRRHVRKIRGAGPGMVTYRNEYTIDAEPHSELELGLSAR